MNDVKNEKYTKYISEGNFNYSVNISTQYKYIYVETPKVACSTIKTVLQKMELRDSWVYREDFEDIHRRELSPLLQPSQIGNFENLMQDKNFLKFCFVRNPYHRLLSVYLEKICGNKKQKKQILSQLGHDSENLEKKVTFEEFVRAVVAQEICSMNSHWRVQYYQTMQDAIEYDFVGKLENFDGDFTDVLENVDIQNYEKYLISEKRHASNANEKIKKYYTAELRDLVYAKFQKDFEYFNYPYALEEIFDKRQNIKNTYSARQVKKSIENNVADNKNLIGLEKIYQNTSEITNKSQSIYLLCVFRDEEMLFDYFIKYYKLLGVTHFIMVDNLSEDKSVCYLKSLGNINITIYRAEGSYKEANFGTKWINELLKQYCKNQYCFVVDIDELFYLDTDEFKNIYDLIADMKLNDNNVIQTLLLDMYPKKINNNYKKGDSFLEHNHFFDQYNIEYYKNKTCLVGGVRNRIFNKEVCIRKFSFFKYDFYSVGMASGYHNLQVNGENANNSDKVSIYKKIIPLLHFKFIKPNLKELFERRVALNEDWDNSTDYKSYVASLSGNSSIEIFDKKYSIKFERNNGMRSFFQLWETDKQIKQKVQRIKNLVNMIQQKEQIINQKTQQLQQSNRKYAIIKKSKSFEIGNLFFRLIKKPYKLITFSINLVKILMK